MLKITENYPALNTYTYLNTSGIGLIPDEHLASAEEFNRELNQMGSLAFEKWRAEKYPELRKMVCEFVNCKNSELAFLPNYSFGLVSLLPQLKNYRKVLLYKDDYPSLRDPFVLGDYVVHFVESQDGFFIDPEEIKQKIINEGIQLFAISHVQYLSGFKADIDILGRFCKENNVVFLVDATQSLGRVNIDFDSLNTDILISSNYKWMNGGFGSGIMCIKDSFLKANPPQVAGYGSYLMKDGKFGYEPSTLSYEGGHLNCTGLNLLGVSLAQKNRIGPEKIINWDDQLLSSLVKGLDSIGQEILGPPDLSNRAGIVCVKGDELRYEKLRGNSLVLTFREGYFRLGPHFYNSLDQIEQTVDFFSELN